MMKTNRFFKIELFEAHRIRTKVNMFDNAFALSNYVKHSLLLKLCETSKTSQLSWTNDVRFEAALEIR